jgi:hypothetical protein
MLSQKQLKRVSASAKAYSEVIHDLKIPEAEKNHGELAVKRALSAT